MEIPRNIPCIHRQRQFIIVLKCRQIFGFHGITTFLLFIE